jgi:hypothetical protein
MREEESQPKVLSLLIIIVSVLMVFLCLYK